MIGSTSWYEPTMIFPLHLHSLSTNGAYRNDLRLRIHF